MNAIASNQQNHQKIFSEIRIKRTEDGSIRGNGERKRKFEVEKKKKKKHLSFGRCVLDAVRIVCYIVIDTEKWQMRAAKNEYEQIKKLK